MARFKLTESHKDFIRSNFTKMSRIAMARSLNIGVTPINTFMKKNRLKVNKAQSDQFRISAMTGRTTFSEKEDEFIKENYLSIPVKTIAKRLNRSGCGVSGRLKSLGLVIPKSIIEQRKIESQYKKGRTPENKGKKQSEFMSPEAIEKTKATRFKKGNLPHNTNYDGHERLCKDGYLEVRVSLGVYKLKQRLVWEEVNGAIPESHIITFKDRNPLNCDIDNLEIISRIENMYRNSRHGFPKEIIPSMVLTKKIENKLNTLQDG